MSWDSLKLAKFEAMQPPNIRLFRDRAKAKRKENRAFFKRLKKNPPKDLDRTVHQLDEEAFSQIDCLDCANCCKTTSPVFKKRDIERLAKRFNIRPATFVERYLRRDEDGEYVLQQAPCPFLGDDNYCSVYEDRPAACASFPHTHRRKFHQLLSVTENNTTVCPAVFHIVERMKEIYSKGW